MIRVGVLGARGRMGTKVCDAVDGVPDLEVVARLDLGDPLEGLLESRTEVAVDFSHPDALMDHLRFCVSHRINLVIGASGMNRERLEETRRLLAGQPGVGVLVAPNFALGAVLMVEFAARAARFFQSAEVIELHHAKKVDAPSGTATHTAERISVARAEAGLGQMPDATTAEVPGARGADLGGVRVHSVRSAGLLAHQEVLLGNPGETLTIRHDSFDRDCFMPGVLLALRSVSRRPGLTESLAPLLLGD